MCKRNVQKHFFIYKTFLILSVLLGCSGLYNYEITWAFVVLRTKFLNSLISFVCLKSLTMILSTYHF